MNCRKTWWGHKLSKKGRGEAAGKGAGGCLCCPAVQQPHALGPMSCCGLRQSLDHPEWLPEQELPFSRHLVCCCQCLFGLGFILAVSLVFTFGGLFLLPKLTKQQAISLFYWVKYMHVPCLGLSKMGGSRSNIIDLQIFFNNWYCCDWGLWLP